MDRQRQIAALKQQLLKDVAYLCHRADLQWSAPIVQTVRELRLAQLPAVFFGGTLRSLLLSRLASRPCLGRPRDLDIVVSGATVSSLREQMCEYVVRETRFGGLQLKRDSWHFDIWPLERTWAFVHDKSTYACFEALPKTTFFNLEAIAVDVWPGPRGTRLIYSGDEQFFHGVLDRIIELNREENPFPALCVVRSLVLAHSTQFAIGPRLAAYLASHQERVSDAELEEVQRQHYGMLRVGVPEMRQWLHHIVTSHKQDSSASVKLDFRKQMNLWGDEGGFPRLNLHLLAEPNGHSEIVANRSYE